MSIWKTGGHVGNNGTLKTSVWRHDVLASCEHISCSNESLRLLCWFSPEKQRAMWAVLRLWSLLHEQLNKVKTQSFTSMQIPKTEHKEHQSLSRLFQKDVSNRDVSNSLFFVLFFFFDWLQLWVMTIFTAQTGQFMVWQLRFLHHCSINHWSVPGSCWKWNQRQSDVLVSPTLSRQRGKRTRRELVQKLELNYLIVAV